MSENTNFDIMLRMMWDMQTPVITVEFLDEKLYGDRWYVTHHILVPSEKDKLTDFCFVNGRNTNNRHLCCINHLDMNLMSALTEFGKKALASQGGKLTFYGN